MTGPDAVNSGEVARAAGTKRQYGPSGRRMCEHGDKPEGECPQCYEAAEDAKLDAFDAIVSVLSGKEWDSGTTTDIARIMQNAGAVIEPAEHVDQHDPSCAVVPCSCWVTR